MSEISGKVVAITGGSSGLGEATARLLASKGARVYLGARRGQNMENIVRDIASADGTASCQTVDVTQHDQVEGFVSGAVQHFGRLDVLINNAGLMPLSPLERLKLDEWERMVDVNIKGVLYGIAAALPRMREQGSGHVITLSSVAGHVVFDNSAIYSGTKYAVQAIAEGLRKESGSGIRSTLISPGAVKSELTSTITDPETSEAVEALYETAIDSDAVARCIAFAIEQPSDVDINEIVLRPTAQSL